MKYTITLADGTKLENLELNGNNYIATAPVDNAIFAGNLKTVEIIGNGETMVLDDAILVSNRIVDGRSWLVFAEKSEQQKMAEDTDSMIVDHEFRLTMLELGIYE